LDGNGKTLKMEKTMKNRLIIFVFLLFLSSSISFGQSKPVWVISFENNLKQKETDWKIEETKEFSNKIGIYNYFYVLKSGIFQSSILINKLADAPNRNPNVAEEAFKEIVGLFEKGILKNTNKVKVENFGDEGFIWTDVKIENTTKTMLLFRKSDVFVQIYAPSESIAKRFGKLVSEQMP